MLAGYYTVAPALFLITGLVLALAQRSVFGALGCLLAVNVLRDIQPLSVPVAGVVVVLVALTVVITARRLAPPAPEPA